MSNRINAKGAERKPLPELLHVSPAPHMRRLDTVTSIMLDVIIALLPALAFGIFFFGMRALYIVLISVLCAVISEACYQLAWRKKVRIGDLSSVVTGLMLGLMLPAGVSFWVPMVGSVFAIVVVKQFFGGIGKNIVNPAIAARVFLMLCWPDQMVRYTNRAGELVSSATPLVEMKAGNAPTISLFNLVLGNCPGAIGEVSAIALGAGFIYLFCRRVVSWQIPVTFVGTIAIISILAPINGEATALFDQVASGSLLLCALFSANDYTTTPVTRGGKIIFGVGCGLITVLIRYFGAYPEGTAFAILIMNLLAPLFESWTKPHRFGGK
ncbi:MAG: RnfABCDGE type electron transport complex subunit D [Ruminococcaceae bacterium]|nr:RnfABCDGE type electron transport complex subunit D [Oscillospiraceae bacterium]